jgi:hypothetical protein
MRVLAIGMMVFEFYHSNTVSNKKKNAKYFSKMNTNSFDHNIILITTFHLISKWGKKKNCIKFHTTTTSTV